MGLHQTSHTFNAENITIGYYVIKHSPTQVLPKGHFSYIIL